MRRAAWFVVVLVSCASTELEVERAHPASPEAPTPAIDTPSVLAPDYDPFADADADAGAHHHGHHP